MVHNEKLDRTPTPRTSPLVSLVCMYLNIDKEDVPVLLSDDQLALLLEVTQPHRIVDSRSL